MNVDNEDALAAVVYVPQEENDNGPAAPEPTAEA
jgi:hypothetical protein